MQSLGGDRAEVRVWQAVAPVTEVYLRWSKVGTLQGAKCYLGGKGPPPSSHPSQILFPGRTAGQSGPSGQQSALCHTDTSSAGTLPPQPVSGSYHHDVLRDKEKDVSGVCWEHSTVQLLHQLLDEVGDVGKWRNSSSFCIRLRLSTAWSVGEGDGPRLRNQQSELPFLHNSLQAPLGNQPHLNLCTSHCNLYNRCFKNRILYTVGTQWIHVYSERYWTISDMNQVGGSKWGAAHPRDHLEEEWMGI